MNITFDDFKNLASQMAVKNQTDTHAIGINPGPVGRLGTYSVTTQGIEKSESEVFQKVRDQLTKALSQELGVTSRDLPKQITVILSGISSRNRLTAGDITNLSQALKQLADARNAAIQTFCDRLMRVNDDIGAKLASCGCGRVSLPAKAPLTKALERVFDAALADMKAIVDVDDLRARTAELADKLESDLQTVVATAFGKDGTSGPLASRLMSVQEGVAESPERARALEREMMDFQTVEMFAENEEPKLDPASTKPADRAAMAKFQLNVFNRRIGALLGDTRRRVGDHVSTGVPIGSGIAKQLDAVLKDKTATVGQIKKNLQDIMNQVLGTEEEPSDFAEELYKIGHEGGRDSQLGKKRLLARKALMMVSVSLNDEPNERLALVSVCRLALADFKANAARAMQHAQEAIDDDIVFDTDDDPCELLAGDPETPRRIDWILSAACRDKKLDTLRTLEKFILDGDTEGIRLLDKQLGDTYVSNAEIDAAFTDVNSEGLREVIASHSDLLDDPNFEIFFQQCTGELPRDTVNGDDVLRIGRWSENPEYRAKLAALVPYVNAAELDLAAVCSLDHPLRSEAGQRMSAPSNYQKSVDDFRQAFDLKKDNSFKTAPLKTKGQLYLDPETGAIKSANRHFGSTVPSKPEENFRLRLSLVDAFRTGGASEAFLARARAALGLGSDAQTTPVSRQVVKQLIIDFDRPESKAPPKPEPQPQPRRSSEGPTFVDRSSFYFVRDEPKNAPPKNEPKIETQKKQPEPPKNEPKIETEQKKQPEPPKNEPKIETQKKQPELPKNEPEVNAPLNQNEQMQEGPHVARTFKAPKEIDVDHPVNYDNLWQHPAGLMRRQLLFLTELDRSRIRQVGVKTLNADDAPSTWLRTMTGDPQLKDLVVDQLKGQIEQLPTVKGHAIDANLLQADLFAAMQRAANLPADRKTDLQLTEIARPLAAKIFSSRRPSVQQVGMMKHALVTAMAMILHGLTQTGRAIENNIIRQGGGLVHADSWTLRENGMDFRSSVTPRTDVETTFKVANTRQFHLTGLSRSELTSEDDTGKKIAFLRFGEVVSGVHSGHGEELLQELAEQTFLNNEALVSAAKNGDSIDLPIVRADLGGNEFVRGGGRPFALTFTPKGATAPITVTIRPKVEHFCLPTDSFKPGNVVISRDEMALNRAAWQSLKARAQTHAGRNGPNAAAVRQLVAQIDAYFAAALAGDEMQAAPNFGAELTRLGARIGVLASLLGDVPSVNCNWGRDRTGVMDNEMKLTWLTLTTNPAQLPPIRLGPGQEDPLRAQRTRMLDTTGNRQLAHQVNCTVHDINLCQSQQTFTVGGREYRGSGLDTLFNVRDLPVFSQRVQDVNVGVVPLRDERGNARTPAQICDQLLPGVSHEIRENGGNGHCFFYSALDQMTQAEKGRAGTVQQFRAAFADNLERKAAEVNRPESTLKGLRKEGGEIMVRTTAGWQALRDAFRPLEEYRDGFRNGNEMADVSHGAFLADMLKRPVTIISANALDTGATKVTFDCDLTTGRPFANQEPIVIYYEQFQHGGRRVDSGHFRAVVPQAS